MFNLGVPMHLSEAFRTERSRSTLGFSPDNKFLLLSDGRMLQILSTESGECIKKIELPNIRISSHSFPHLISITFNPDMTYLALSNNESTIFLLNILNWELDFIIHGGFVESRIKFINNSQLFIRQDIRYLGQRCLPTQPSIILDIHDLMKQGKSRYRLNTEPYSTSKGYIHVGSEEFYFFNVKNFSSYMRISEDNYLALAYQQQDCNDVIADEKNGKFEIWHLKSDSKLCNLVDADQVDCRSIDFSPDGRLMASGGWYRHLSLWSVESGKKIKTFSEDPEIDFISFLPNPHLLLLLGADEYTGIFNIMIGEKIDYCFPVPENEKFNQIVLSSDKTFMAIPTNNYIYVYQIE